MTLRDALDLTPAEIQQRPQAPVTVAVLDSGIDATHPELAGLVLRAWQFDRIDGLVVPRELDGPVNNDEFGHGTAVASVIQRSAPNARLLDYRILGSDNSGLGDVLVKALEMAVQSEARVINMSLAAKATFAPQLARLCELAYRANKIVVAAKRNMPLADFGFPAELTTAVSVDRSRFDTPLQLVHRPGEKIEWVAHGDDVEVAAPGGGHTIKTGTSFATPAISAIVALLLGAFPDLRPFEVKSYLRAIALS